MTFAAPLRETRPGSGSFSATFGDIDVKIRHRTADLFDLRLIVFDHEMNDWTQCADTFDLSRGARPGTQDLIRKFGGALDLATNQNPMDVDAFLGSGLSVLTGDVTRTILPPSSLYDAVSLGCPIAQAAHELPRRALGAGLSGSSAWSRVQNLPEGFHRACHAYPSFRWMARKWRAGLLAEAPRMWARLDSDGAFCGLLTLWEEAPDDMLITEALRIGTSPSLDVAMCGHKGIYLPAHSGLVPEAADITEVLSQYGLWVSNVELSGLLCQAANLDLMPDSVVLPETA